MTTIQKLEGAVEEYRLAKEKYKNNNSIINMREVTRTKHIMMEILDKSKPIEEQIPQESNNSPSV